MSNAVVRLVVERVIHGQDESPRCRALPDPSAVFGKGSIMRLGKNDKSMDVDTVCRPARSASHRARVGGLPRGRWSRSTARNPPARPRLRCIRAEAQKKGGICASSNAEHALTRSMPASSASCRRPPDLGSPTLASRGSRSPTPWCRSGAVDILVIDSVAAAGPARRARRRDGDQMPGLQRA